MQDSKSNPIKNQRESSRLTCLQICFCFCCLFCCYIQLRISTWTWIRKSILGWVCICSNLNIHIVNLQFAEDYKIIWSWPCRISSSKCSTLSLNLKMDLDLDTQIWDFQAGQNLFTNLRPIWLTLPSDTHYFCYSALQICIVDGVQKS